MFRALCLLNLITAMATVGFDPTVYPTVGTEEGVLRGLTRRSATGRTFYSFKGIPYARPPLGEFRFEPPQRHPGWPGVRNAFEHGSKCLQFDFHTHDPAEGSEDCLFLNVYTPQLPDRGDDSTEKLPVMVYIHGGGFETGSGDENDLGPHYFMDNQVVMVTINYRLGTFGFFTTHDHHAPGNNGMRDMIMALEWVRDNILNFGGDPGKVTIFGESAGGSAVSLLVLSPLARGLFHRAISQSGGAMTPFAANGRDKGSAKRIAKLLNSPIEDSAEMVRCLREKPAEEVIEAGRRIGYRVMFAPRVDAEVDNPVLPEDPRVLLESGRFARVPWMHGVTQEEGTLYIKNCLDAQIIERSADNLLGDLEKLGRVADLTDEAVTRVFDHETDPLCEVAKVRFFYSSLTSPAQRVARMVSDRKFVAPISEEIRLASAHTSIYKYVLDYPGPGLHVPCQSVKGPLPDFGPTHTDDLPYLFVQDDKPIPPAGSEPHTMVRFMVSLWSSFARTGRPSSDVLSMPAWPAFSQRQQRHMRLNLEPTLGERFREEGVLFWQSMPINEPWRHTVK